MDMNKILFPEANINKETMVAYYKMIAPYMLPHIKNRPLSLKQFPDGIKKPGYYRKHIPDYFPDYIPRFTLPMHNTHAAIDMVGANTAQDLMYIASQNTIEFHLSLSQIQHLEEPDQIILDFDPSDNDFEKVRTLALTARDILTERKMPCFVKTTGSRGLHVHIPFKPHLRYAEVKPIAKELAAYIQIQCPDIATIELRKNKRGNKVFIDYLRNDYGMTAVAAYSLRANQAAGIATPIHWDELLNKSLHAQSFTIKNINKRMQGFKDPWVKFKN